MATLRVGEFLQELNEKQRALVDRFRLWKAEAETEEAADSLELVAAKIDDLRVKLHTYAQTLRPAEADKWLKPAPRLRAIDEFLKEPVEKLDKEHADYLAGQAGTRLMEVYAPLTQVTTPETLPETFGQLEENLKREWREAQFDLSGGRV